MKRIFAVIMSLALIMSIAACGKNAKNNESSTTAMQTTQETENSTQAADKNEEASVNICGEVENLYCEGDLGLLKYRMDYYDIPAPFAKIIDSEVFEPWYEKVVKENPNETNQMVMKRFIEHFNVSREDFDRANLEWAKIIVKDFKGEPMMNPQDFSNQETDEVYNADILYTFDDEIINNYYLSHDYPFCYASEYEEAVANGTYETRTTDWVDVEQMEAEINAKYGAQETTAE
ncbi:MAG: hypothetical protein ACI4JG_08765 [Acutalibacteraceae bacterium]